MMMALLALKEFAILGAGKVNVAKLPRTSLIVPAFKISEDVFTYAKSLL